MKNNLVSKLRNTLYMGLAVGTLGSYLSACKETIIGPEPKLSQTATLENYVDVNYKATLENVSQATRKTMYNGNLINTKSISGSSYIETLRNMIKGSYSFILENPDAKPDTARVEIPNYKPEANLSGLQTNFDDYSQLELDLAPRISDKNPEDNPVQVVSARSLDGKTEVSLAGSKLIIKPNGSFGLYQVETTIGGLNGGLENIMIQGEVIRAPEQIAFQGIFNGNDDIYLINVNGTDERRLTTHPSQDLEPSFSPDGKKIAFTTNRDGKISIYKMNVDGSNQTSIASALQYAQQPAWSPDGTKIAFRYKDSNSSGIATINSEGGKFTRLVIEPLGGRVPGAPSWSPDGSQLTFMTNRDGNWEIYKMNSDGTSQENITNNSSDDQEPEWSPDGKKISFTSNRSGNFEIYSFNLNTKNLERLTNDPGSDLESAWSSDGSSLAFTSTRTGTFQLFLMNADGTVVTSLKTSVQAGFPSWRPKQP